MSVVFTQRHFQLIEKFLLLSEFKFNAENFVSNLSRCIECCDNIFSLPLSEFTVEIVLERTDDEDDDEFFVDVDLKIFERIIFSHRLSFDSAIDNLKIENIKVQSAIYKIEQLIGKEFTKCKLENCNKLAMLSGLCERDFQYDYTRNDECCICKEDGGAWAKLHCNHFIHACCLSKLQQMGKITKCPLCRTNICFKNVNYNYLFLENN